MTPDPTAAQIKAWLKATGRDREWLGQQLDSHKRTVDNWLSAGQPIPGTKAALITRLMADDEAAEARRKQLLDPVAQVFSIEVDQPTFRAYNQAALNHGQTIEDWAITELDRAAESYFSTRPSTPFASRLNEPLVPYVLPDFPPAEPPIQDDNVQAQTPRGEGHE